ncbi:MAG: hypothetical protein V2A69_02065 [Pseudomonadota bacterium]
MELDKKLEVMLTKKVALERLKIEDETIRAWKEKFEQLLKKDNDYRSLEINLKKILQTMDNRLRILQSEMKELI